MNDWTSGFYIDEAFHTWGTRFNSVAPGRVESGYTSVELPCRSAYGFATVYAEPTAPRPDRPVTTVAYELADTGTAPRYLFAELVKRLGQADKVSREDGPDRANADSVVLHANWTRGKVRIGLSLYGAPRPSGFGDGLGRLYLSWVDADAAAAPFLAEWTAANQAMADDAAGARPRIFSVRYPIYDVDYPPPKPRDLALSMPELLQTPPPIAALLRPTTFALWSDAAGSRWYLSTGRSTIVVGGPATSTINYGDVAPAKGSGFAALDIGSWSVRDVHQSTSIKDALEALEKLPNLRIERYSGHDA